MGSIPISHRGPGSGATDSSRVEHLFDKQGVVGSSPTRWSMPAWRKGKRGRFKICSLVACRFKSYCRQALKCMFI